MPMRRRSVASASLLSVAMSWPNRVISPRVGRSERNRSRSSERLAGAGGAGKELERMRVDAEGNVAQDLGTHAVAQADILEPDHVPLPPRTPPRLLLPSPPTSHNGRHGAICPTCSGQRSASISGFIAAPRPFHAALPTATDHPGLAELSPHPRSARRICGSDSLTDPRYRQGGAGVAPAGRSCRTALLKENPWHAF